MGRGGGREREEKQLERGWGVTPGVTQEIIAGQKNTGHPQSPYGVMRSKRVPCLNHLFMYFFGL